MSLLARQLPFEVNEAMKGDGVAPLWQCSAVQCSGGILVGLVQSAALEKK